MDTLPLLCGPFGNVAGSLQSGLSFCLFIVWGNFSSLYLGLKQEASEGNLDLTDLPGLRTQVLLHL